ncbi:hypothetical protein PG985_008466 [Apiospora marii]|uniref:Uncharacterized protein n=1 Tax=Apiospora marii TaxID=335849 RepID=A0ABR1SS29_9PEZI
MSRKLKDSCDLCSASKGPQHHREAVTTPTVHGAQASDIIGDFDWASEISSDNPISGTLVLPPPCAYEPDQPEPPDSSASLAAESDAIPSARGDCAKTAALILEGLNAAKSGSHHPPQHPGCKIAEGLGKIAKVILQFAARYAREQPQKGGDRRWQGSEELYRASGAAHRGFASIHVAFCHPGSHGSPGLVMRRGIKLSLLFSCRITGV